MSREFERPFSAGIVGFDDPPARWLNAPILIITGSKDPKFSAAMVDRLRQYVQAGGMIFSWSEGGSPEFTRAMKVAASQICDGRYEMRQLPKDHPLFRLQYEITGNLLSLGNGSRELWIHSPVDLGATYQAQRFDEQEPWGLWANAYVYAVGKIAHYEMPQPVPPSDASKLPETTVAHLRYAGNDDPEPGAGARFAQLAPSTMAMRVHVVDARVADLDPKLTPLADLTGTAFFALSPAEIIQLRNYLNHGGMLLGEAVGGAKPTFNASFAALVQQLYPGEFLEPIANNGPLYADPADPARSADIYLTRYSIVAYPQFHKDHKSLLLGLAHHAPIVILFSPADLSTGLVGISPWGVAGYSPESAQIIMANVIRYAGRQ